MRLEMWNKEEDRRATVEEIEGLTVNPIMIPEGTGRFELTYTNEQNVEVGLSCTNFKVSAILKPHIPEDEHTECGAREE